jgi:hypothetical protein
MTKLLDDALAAVRNLPPTEQDKTVHGRGAATRSVVVAAHALLACAVVLPKPVQHTG